MNGKRLRERGFTLGEMLTSMAVVAISLSLAVPSYQNVVRNNRRATAVNQLVSTFHLARSEAVTRNAQVTVCASTDAAACTDGADWHDGWIAFPDADQDRQVDVGETILGAAAGPQDLTIESGEFASFIVYRPNGRVMANAADENTGAFTFCDARGADFARVVIVNPTGQPVLSEHMADGSDPECPEA
jgi:type IV fimbrial biogenesis protein FimT